MEKQHKYFPISDLKVRPTPVKTEAKIFCLSVVKDEASQQTVGTQPVRF